MNSRVTFALAIFNRMQWRGGRVVMQQIANLSTGNCRQGSSPCLSAKIVLKYMPLVLIEKEV